MSNHKPRTEAEQKAVDVLATAARLQSQSPLYTIPDENGGHFYNRQKVKEDIWKGVIIGLLVMVVGGSICYVGKQIIDLIVEDHASVIRELTINRDAVRIVHEEVMIIAEGQRNVMENQGFLGRALQKHDRAIILPKELSQPPLPKPFDYERWERRKR